MFGIRHIEVYSKYGASLSIVHLKADELGVMKAHSMRRGQVFDRHDARRFANSRTPNLNTEGEPNMNTNRELSTWKCEL